MRYVWPLIHRLVDLILPPRCLVSGGIVDSPGKIAPQAWATLRFIGAPYCEVCGYPFDFEVEKEALCAACLRERPLYASARTALIYDDASRGVILKFKHGDRTDGAQTLAAWLARAGAAQLAAAAVILPVPLHRWRLLRRRYNQAALLAQALAKSSGRACMVDALVRRRATAIQGHKGFRERHRNVKNAFAVHPKRLAGLQGKTVVLVDDVYTSGATIKECTKALLDAGVAAVHVLTVARVVKPDYVL